MQPDSPFIEMSRQGGDQLLREARASIEEFLVRARLARQTKTEATLSAVAGFLAFAMDQHGDANVVSDDGGEAPSADSWTDGAVQ